MYFPNLGALAPSIHESLTAGKLPPHTEFFICQHCEQSTQNPKRHGNFCEKGKGMFRDAVKDWTFGSGLKGLERDFKVMKAIDVLVGVVGTLLANTAAKNATRAAPPCAALRRLSIYDSDVTPRISVVDYLANWAEHVKVDAVEVICAVVLLDRALQSEFLILTPRKAHRLLLAALALSHKMRNDVPFEMSWLADVGGVERSELHRLECAFLLDLRWEAYVSEEDYRHYAELFTTLQRTGYLARGAAAAPRQPPPPGADVAVGPSLLQQ